MKGFTQRVLRFTLSSLRVKNRFFFVVFARKTLCALREMIYFMFVIFHAKVQRCNAKDAELKVIVTDL